MRCPKQGFPKLKVSIILGTVYFYGFLAVWDKNLYQICAELLLCDKSLKSGLGSSSSGLGSSVSTEDVAESFKLDL